LSGNWKPGIAGELKIAGKDEEKGNEMSDKLVVLGRLHKLNLWVC